MDKFGLDLSLVARLGGHSQPRTHRGAERFPGMTITYALIQMLEKCAENSDRAKIICKARATRFLMNKARDCVGVEYEYGGKILQELLATERKYVSNLRTMCQLYIDPLRSEAERLHRGEADQVGRRL